MVNIRKFNIDFTAENFLPNGSVLGYQGEHNATALSIIPPAEMTEHQEIVAYKVAFGLTNCRYTRSEMFEKTSPVMVLLSSQITSSKEISVQLEGYGTDGNLVVKSPKVEKLVFEDSVGGVCIDFDGQSGTAADITANTLARHTHNNADVLKELGENGSGNLTYKGEEIKGGLIERPTAEQELEIINFDGASHITGNRCYISLYSIPADWGVDVETEIKDIQFKDTNGNYVSINELAWVDFIPYGALFKKVFLDDTDYYCFAVILINDATPNWVASIVNSGTAELWMKVIYYTD